MKEVVFIIKPDGKVTSDVTGFQGKTCITEMAKVYAAIGGVESQEPKPEMYQPDIGDRTTVGGG
jgi:hypothetical protein